MADRRISALDAAASVATNTVVPIVRNGAAITEKATLAQIAGVVGTAATGFQRTETDSIARSLYAVIAERGPSVKDFGAVGDGTTDDAEAFQAAASAAADAGSQTVFVPPGTYRRTSGVSVSTSGLTFVGVPEMSIIADDGDFHGFTFGGGMTGGGLIGLEFNSAERGNFADVKVESAFRLSFRDMMHFSPYQAYEFSGALSNQHDLSDVGIPSFRGVYAIRFLGTAAAKVGGSNLYQVRVGQGGSGSVALEIDGDVSGIGLDGFYANGAPAGASTLNHGIRIRNSAGEALGPRFIVGTDVQVEFAKVQGVRVEDVDLLILQGLYSSAAFEDGLWCGADADKVYVINPQIGVNGRAGIHFAGTRLAVVGGSIVGNSANAYANNRGEYDGIHVAGTANYVQISGVRIGDNGAITHRYGVYGASGAQNIVVTGCNLANNVLAGARDDTGLAVGNMRVVGSGGLNSSFEPGAVIGAQAGFRGIVTPTVSGGAITAVTVTDAGYHYESAPSIFAVDPAGTGSGFSATVTVANGRITGVTSLVGGSNYSADTILYLRPANGAGGIRALNTAATNANLTIRGQAAGTISLGNENGNGLDVNATRVDVLQPLRLPEYTVSTLPSAATHARSLIYVSDESGGACVAYSRGTTWRRIYDNAVVS